MMYQLIDMKRPCRVFVFLFICIKLVDAANSQLTPSCLEENGNPVDWIIVYKFPHKTYNNSGNSGEKYMYLSSNGINQAGNWILSKQNISSNASVISRILNPVFDRTKGMAYLIYNDEVPKAGNSYISKFGHAKGVLAFGNDTGYWLIHSVPKFPRADYYYFPEGSKLHGQIFFCVNYNLYAINQIGEQLRYLMPQIYKNQKNSAVSKLSPSVQTLFTSKPSFIKHPPWENYVKLSSKFGANFISFSKHAEFHKDLYGDFVAPVLESPLFTETWMDGEGPLPSNCSIPYPVWNIKKINISINDENKVKTFSFCSTVDHSKWAVTNSSSKPFICIGDINRMKSQEKRGGGTLCLYSKVVWKAFYTTIATIEACFHNAKNERMNRIRILN